MSEITFETKTIVRLGKKIVGEIIRTPEGFYYKVKGNKAVGEIFPTLAQCKESLDPAPAPIINFHCHPTEHDESDDIEMAKGATSDWAKGQMGFGS